MAITGRYVRLYQQANTGWNVAEVEVYGVEYAAVTPGGLAGDVSANYLVNANYARDGNTDTRANIIGCPCIGSWVALDLGAVLPITQVQAFFKDGTFSGRVEYSLDGSSWTTALSINPTNGVWQTYAVSFTARYVRLYQTGNFGWTLGEFEVYGLLPTPTPVPTATPVVTAPVASKSLYIYSSGVDFKLYGCDEATYGPEDAFVVLDFGQPWVKTQNNQSVQAVRTWNFDQFTISQVEAAIQSYATAYWNCAVKAPIRKHITLAIGLNNDSADQKYVTTEHGIAWRAMVHNLNTWLRFRSCGLKPNRQQPNKACPINSYISIAAAMDIEMSGASGRLGPEEAINWIQGYALNKPVPPIYNFGTCQDCPYLGPYLLPPADIVIPYTDPQWTYDDAWYLSWGVVPLPTPIGPPDGLTNLHIYPVPEIYTGIQPTVYPTPYHANQWSQLSDYGSGRGSRMWFYGVMTQFSACANDQGTPKAIEDDIDGTCYPYYVPGTDQRDTTRMTNRPSEGWQQLQGLIANYQSSIQWVTDIGWSYNYNSRWRP